MNNPLHLKVKTEIAPIIMIIISAVASIFFYQKFPETVATHWNIEGVADGFSGRAFAAFFFPGLILALYLMFNFLPLLDPKKERYAQFVGVYLRFRDIMVFFMVFIYFITGLVNLGYNINVGLWVSGSVGLLFVLIGNYLGKIKRNWFVGIKTPWTLSSEEVWNKTHRFSGKLFIIAGLVMMISGIVPVAFRLPLFIANIVILVFGTFVYSYIVFVQEKKNKKQ